MIGRDTTTDTLRTAADYTGAAGPHKLQVACIHNRAAAFGVVREGPTLAVEADYSLAENNPQTYVGSSDGSHC